MTTIVLLLFLALLAPATVLAGGPSDAPFVPNARPTLNVRPAPGPIRVDGNLDDPGWRDAARAINFTETSPGDQVRPPVDTEVLVTYNDTHLFVGFLCRDDPALVRASLRARDEIFQDDYIGLILDTYDNAAWAYELFVNPYGIQGDLRWTRSGEDIGFDVVWESVGRITDEGWQVEVSIPFKSLRFPNRDVQEWRATFWRNHPRDSRRRYTWATVSRDDPCFLCQFGTIRGIEGVKPGGSLEVLPAVIGSQTGALRDGADPGSGFDTEDPDFEGSVGLRYGFSSSVAAALTVNPDFSQVESDVEQIDVNTTFALFFPERRPFFQEGSDLYQSYYNVVYTRQINDPTVAARITGRTDKTSFFYLAAHDDNTPLILPFEERSLFAAPGRSVSNIARARRTFGEDNFVGAVVTDRHYDGGGSGTVGGIDAFYRFKQNYVVKMQGLVSYTDEPNRPDLLTGALDSVEFDRGKHTSALDGETYGGHGAFVNLEREARHWQSDLEYWDTSPTFRADNGFIVRNNERRLAFLNEYLFYPDNRVLDTVAPQVLLWRRWNAFSLRKGQAIENTVQFVFKKQTSLLLGYDRSEERYRDRDFTGIDLYYTEVNTAFSEVLQFGFWYGTGDRLARLVDDPDDPDDAPFLGTGRSYDIWGTIKPWRRLAIEPWFTYSLLKYSDTDEIFFEGYIWRVKTNYQFTRELFLRLVLQYDDFSGELNVEPLLSYEVNPFTVFYLGATVNEVDFDHESIDPSERTGDGFEPTSWQVFFKFQYFFRV